MAVPFLTGHRFTRVVTCMNTGYASQLHVGMALDFAELNALRASSDGLA